LIIFIGFLRKLLKSSSSVQDIDPKMSQATDILTDFMVVFNDEKAAVYNKIGNQITPFEYDEIEAFSSGVLRTKWGSDGSMFVGMTSRGWNSTGPNVYGLQKLVWTGKTPFEFKTMKVQDDGFLLEFTQPVSKTAAADLASYQMTSFTYHYHSRYGSEILDRQTCMVHEAKVSEDGMQVKLVVHGMRKGYIHELKAPGLKNTGGQPLVHDVAYYTLNDVPGGEITTPAIAPTMVASNEAVVQPKRQNKMPETWMDGPERQIQMGTQPGLQYDTKVLEVKAGAKVELAFNNNDDMTHNLVIVKKGDAIEKITELSENLGLDGPAQNYVPDSELILFHTGLLEPGKSESLFFEAPTEPGEYRYLCTFPGHARVMRGTLIVK